MQQSASRWLPLCYDARVLLPGCASVVDNTTKMPLGRGGGGGLDDDKLPEPVAEWRRHGRNSTQSCDATELWGKLNRAGFWRLSLSSSNFVCGRRGAFDIPQTCFTGISVLSKPSRFLAVAAVLSCCSTSCQQAMSIKLGHDVPLHHEDAHGTVQYLSWYLTCGVWGKAGGSPPPGVPFLWWCGPELVFVLLHWPRYAWSCYGRSLGFLPKNLGDVQCRGWHCWRLEMLRFNGET